MRDSEVHYADHDDKLIAYKVFGSGPCDLLVEQQSCPIDLMLELPQFASFMEALSGMARVIVFDTPGHGASDQLVDWPAATLENQSDGCYAVLDALGVERVTVMDMSHGGLGVTFAATHPERVQAVIVVHLRSSFPEIRAMSPAQRKKFALARIGTRSLEDLNPRVAHDPALREWWGRAHRLLRSPEVSREEIEFGARIDTDSVLSAVRVPTLVLHRRDNRVFDVEIGRAAASRIPDCRFVELPGSETDLYLGDSAAALHEIAAFLAEQGNQDDRDTSVVDRVLATVLFTDMVSSTEQLAAHGDDAWRQLLDDHDKQADRLVRECRGRIIRSTGDGVLATFDGPARAVRCAAELVATARQQGITLRAGLHTGEIELRPPDIAGIAVHTASRIADLAPPNEILVSRTVVDLTAGSGLEFEPRGEHQLKGVPGTWQLFAAGS